ncbi:MAG: FAD:protein FMN transferase [Bryobacteraceae bacterium]|jgi:thiamine biosynthesis lipoprotein
MKFRKTLLLVGAVGFVLALRFATVNARVEPPGEVIQVQRPLMGTIWNIEVVDHGRPDAARHAISQAYAELVRIDALMSEWKPESPISQVNAAAGKAPVEVPAELRAMIERSIDYGEKSQGTFDITWHGMAGIWHFDDAFVPPSNVAVEAALKRVNFREIRVEGNSVFLPRAGMSIGLGGIAKGYSVDRAAAVLAQAGFRDTLVDGGGDLFASGVREDRTPWRLGVQNPREEHGKMIGVVLASNQAVATSGDYERFRIVNGIRYHHIIDPRTGYPANASMSVTVIAESAERAVVLCKPIFILGAEKGLAVARAEGVEALIIDSAGKRYQTEGFAHVFEER